MVRLKVEKDIQVGQAKIVFQFQYGAIKRVKWGSYCAIFEKFQFQYGAIKRRFQLVRRARQKSISIPIWCD